MIESSSALILTLFGSIQIERHGRALSALATDKAGALLAYLVVEGAPQRRETLAALFWPEMNEPRARANLSQTLYVLRKACSSAADEPPLLLADARTVQLNPVAPLVCDFLQLRQSLAGCPSHHPHATEECEACCTTLQRGIDLLQGEFLAGLSLADCPEFEAWLRTQRTLLLHQTVTALQWLVRRHEQRGDRQAALTTAQKLVTLEPFDEAAQLRFLRLLMQNGQRSTALSAFEQYRTLLQQELGDEPGGPLLQFYQQIKADEPGARRGSVPAPPATGFVGRSAELSRLHGRLTDALTGAGQITFVTGEAGFGKTALLQTLAHQAQTQAPSLLVAGGNCNAYTGIGDPYLPIRAVLALLVGDVATNQASAALAPEQAARLRQVAPTAIQALVEVAPDLVGTLLPPERLLACSQQLLVDNRQREAVQKLVAQKERERLQSNGVSHSNARPQLALFTQMTAFLQRVTTVQPLLLWLDDLHWADMGTVSLLMHLVRNLQQCRLLLIGAFRPSEVMAAYNPTGQARPAGSHHPLEAVYYEVQRHLGEIEVALEAADGRAFVADLLDRQPNRLDGHFRERFYQYTQGNALFATELLQSMLARGDLVRAADGHWETGPTLDWETVPPRVEGVIAQRIARLPEELREALTLAGVEGENFHAEVVAALQGVDRRQMVRWLSSELDRQHGLVTLQGIETIGAQPVAHYRFRHILFQKYLYHQLDRAERIYLHGTVGATLETLYHDQPERLESLAGQLACHYEEAQQWLKAAEWLFVNGKRAFRLSALEEAIVTFTKAIQQLQLLPETVQTLRLELQLQISLGGAIYPGHGFNEKLQQCYHRAEILSKLLKESTQLFNALHGLARYNILSGDIRVARDIAMKMLEIIEYDYDAKKALEANLMAGIACHWLGKFQQSVVYTELAEQSLAEIHPHHPLYRHGEALYGENLVVHGRCYTAYSLWQLGYPDQALYTIQKTIAFARQTEHPNSIAYALNSAAYIHFLRHETRQALTVTTELQQVMTQYGITFWPTELWQSWALLEQDNLGQASLLFAQCFSTDLSQWQLGTLNFPITVLAQILARQGDYQSALKAVQQGIAAGEAYGDQSWCAEYYRLRGQFLFMGTTTGLREIAPEIETCFRKAIEVAQEQKAKSWELRVTTSLARFFIQQNRRTEAKQMLQAIYSWFSEGFATKDLQEAKVLLQAMT